MLDSFSISGEKYRYNRGKNTDVRKYAFNSKLLFHRENTGFKIPVKAHRIARNCRTGVSSALLVLSASNFHYSPEENLRSCPKSPTWFPIQVCDTHCLKSLKPIKKTGYRCHNLRKSRPDRLPLHPLNAHEASVWGEGAFSRFCVPHREYLYKLLRRCFDRFPAGVGD